MAVHAGSYVSIDYGDMNLTDELKKALVSLDADCRFGSGGTWEIHEEEPQNGVPFRAVFVDTATDELVWNSAASAWTDGAHEDDGDDDDAEDPEEDDEEYMTAFFS